MAGAARVPVGTANYVAADNGMRLAPEAKHRLPEQNLDVRALVDPGRVRGPAELAARAAPEFLRPSAADLGNARGSDPRIVQLAVAAPAVGEFRLPHGGGISADDGLALVHLVEEVERVAAGHRGQFQGGAGILIASPELIRDMAGRQERGNLVHGRQYFLPGLPTGSSASVTLCCASQSGRAGR